MTARSLYSRSFLFLFAFLIYISEIGGNRLSHQIKIACIGDSITRGGSRCGGPSYTRDLQILLGTKYNVTGYGVGSRTMLRKGLCNDSLPCSWWNTSSYAAAMRSDAAIVTIMLGTNDAKDINWKHVQQDLGDEYETDYKALISQFRSMKTRPTIFALIPPPTFHDPYGINSTVTNHILPVVLAKIATSENVILVNTATAFSLTSQGAESFFCDGVHPTKAGQRIIAQTIADAITSSSG